MTYQSVITCHKHWCDCVNTLSDDISLVTNTGVIAGVVACSLHCVNTLSDDMSVAGPVSWKYILSLPQSARAMLSVA